MDNLVSMSQLRAQIAEHDPAKFNFYTVFLFLRCKQCEHISEARVCVSPHSILVRRKMLSFFFSFNFQYQISGSIRVCFVLDLFSNMICSNQFLVVFCVLQTRL